ncbi:MAG TPA: PAS domain-containing protein [Stellaceae bacterium]|nr:PAS domain-containing protein [Stellaceae bacterium]
MQVKAAKHDAAQGATIVTRRSYPSPVEATVEVKDTESLEQATTDPVLKRLYAYWRQRRGAKRFPSRNEIDPLDFGFALGRVSLIEVLDGPRRFRYRLVATTLTEHLGYEMTGKYLDEIPESQMRTYTEALYAKALAVQAPYHTRDEIVLDDRRWKHEALVLPLSANDRTIDMLMIYRTTERPVRVWRDPT